MSEAPAERRRVRQILAGAGAIALLAASGVVVVAAGTRQVPPNIDLDCRFGEGHCTAILELHNDQQKLINGTPDSAQCAALRARPDDTTGPLRRVYRAMVEATTFRQVQGIDTRIAEDWAVLPLVESVDGGVPAPRGCYVEVRLSVRVIQRVDGGRVLDGQAPAWRDKVNALGVGSIVKPSHRARRPAYTLNSGCRAHVWFGEQPCTASENIVDGGFAEDPDGGS
jgi:hypothetical protein